MAQTAASVQLARDVVLNADIWSEFPEILAAGYGFEGIIGVPGLFTADDLDLAIQAGAGVNLDWAVQDPAAAFRNLTSAASALGVEAAGYIGQPPLFLDAMPIEFSWPLLPSTVSFSDIQITLNTGEVITPQLAGLNPNYDYNEGHVIVVFGDFGNRLTPGTAGARYPVSIQIVEDDNPLMAIGPEGPVSIVGLTQASSNPYVSGPQLVGARLSEFSAAGDFSPASLSNALPNDGGSYYADDAMYRLRLFTSGGFSPDGVSGFLPTEFEKYFRLEATLSDGSVVPVTADGLDYDLGVGTLKVIGIADLGAAVGDETVINPVQYQEDHDNYFDIILSGDAAAVSLLSTVVIPTSAEAGYSDIYNPGGPGRTPQSGTVYTEPAAPQRIGIDVSLEALGTVSYAVQAVSAYDLDNDLPVVFRLFNSQTGTHFYTSSSIEASGALGQGYAEEGVPFSNEGGGADLVELKRFYSSGTSDFIYTSSAAEIAVLSADGSGYALESESLCGFSQADPGAVAIYRFFSAAASDHFFTSDWEEGAAAPGYVYEGVAWYAIDLQNSATAAPMMPQKEACPIDQGPDASTLQPPADWHFL